MTLKELRKLYDLNRLIERNKRRLEELQTRLEPGSMNLSGMPRNPSPKNMTEEIVPLLVDLKERIQKEQEECIKEQLALETYLHSVPDYQTRLIMKYRFVDLKSWQDIALEVGGNNTEDSVKKRVYRYIKKSQNNKSCPESPDEM